MKWYLLLLSKLYPCSYKVHTHFMQYSLP